MNLRFNIFINVPDIPYQEERFQRYLIKKDDFPCILLRRTISQVFHQEEQFPRYHQEERFHRFLKNNNFPGIIKNDFPGILLRTIYQVSHQEERFPRYLLKKKNSASILSNRTIPQISH